MVLYKSHKGVIKMERFKKNNRNNAEEIAMRTADFNAKQKDG